jgi:hypothetical protein
MAFSGFLPSRVLPVSVVVAGAIGLSGCFDLEQKVGLHSNGSGSYAVAISANGLMGEALNKHDADFDITDEDNRAVTHKVRHGDTTTTTSEVAFRDLSDLKLGDETVTLHVKGNSGDTSDVNFHRAFHVEHAVHRHDDEEGDHIGKDILETMFDGHTYKYSVWLPGRIEHIGQIRIGDHVVHPTVWSDRYGHTITWKMPLTDMFLARQIDFDVDFAAKGNFHDTHSLPGSHHIHRHHHHDDDDDDDDSDHT